MAKIAATFEQQQADAVVQELARLNIDDLDWTVHNWSDNRGTGVAPVLGLPAGGLTGSGAAGAGGGPAMVPALFGGNDDLDDDLLGGDDEDDYLRQARDRGATVIVVHAPEEAEDQIRTLFSRHSGGNINVS